MYKIAPNVEPKAFNPDLFFQHGHALGGSREVRLGQEFFV
jgi:hypothetical protein